MRIIKYIEALISLPWNIILFSLSLPKYFIPKQLRPSSIIRSNNAIRPNLFQYIPPLIFRKYLFIKNKVKISLEGQGKNLKVWVSSYFYIYGEWVILG